MAELYARKIAPEAQISPLMEDLRGPLQGTYLEGIALRGLSRFHTNISEELRPFFNHMDLVEGYLQDFNEGDRTYDTKSEILQEFIPPLHKENYSDADVEALEKALIGKRDDLSLEAAALSIVTGKKYNVRTLCGSCQGDWIIFYYPVEEWPEEAIRNFETEYFNLGSEWIIHEEETDPKSPEDVQGCSFYAHSTDYEEVKREIGEAYIVSPEDITLYVPIGTKIIYGTV